MWHSAQRAEISEEICMFRPVRCQAAGIWLISVDTNNEELLIVRQRFRNHGYIDGNSWSRKLWKESFRQHQESSQRESTIYPCNARDSASCPINRHYLVYTWSDNKVRELATMCLPWQQWAETSLWFDGVGISAFYSCVVVDLWQSLSE
jgi:hypothetical protein